MRITEFLRLEAVVPHLAARTKADVLTELAASVSKVTPSIAVTRIHEVLAEREKIGSTGMEKGVAIPHGRLGELASLVACFGVSQGRRRLRRARRPAFALLLRPGRARRTLPGCTSRP